MTRVGDRHPFEVWDFNIDRDGGSGRYSQSFVLLQPQDVKVGLRPGAQQPLPFEQLIESVINLKPDALPPRSRVVSLARRLCLPRVV